MCVHLYINQFTRQHMAFKRCSRLSLAHCMQASARATACCAAAAAAAQAAAMSRVTCGRSRMLNTGGTGSAVTAASPACTPQFVLHHAPPSPPPPPLPLPHALRCCSMWGGGWGRRLDVQQLCPPPPPSQHRNVRCCAACLTSAACTCGAPCSNSSAT